VWHGRSWEDPFLYFDKRGNWHLLAHTYTQETYGQGGNPVSGHGFSTDGIRWHYAVEEPYNNTVAQSDGTSRTYSTVERPKLVFADAGNPHTPTHLFNGVSPV